MDINPYESPREPPAPPAAPDDHSTLAGMTGRFTVNTPEPHEVEVYCSRWTGLEIYRIDGVERLRVRSFGLSIVRQLEIGDEEKHVLEIALKSFPWWSGSASLDGIPIVSELFPTERRDSIVGFIIVVVIALAAAGWLLWHVM